jgi:hypothetical protein
MSAELKKASREALQEIDRANKKKRDKPSFLLEIKYEQYFKFARVIRLVLAY